jgi:cholesterol transport system auxiliary component
MEEHAMSGPRARAWLGLLATAALLAGCSGLQPAATDAGNTFVLQARPLAPRPGPASDAVVEVSAPRAWPGFDTPRMAYVQRRYELDYFASHRWADTPARMLAPLLADALAQSRGFRAVVQTPSTVPAELRVTGELVRLQQNFLTHPSRVELTVRIDLLDVRGKRLLATRVFDEAEAAATDDPYGGVAAANAALQRVLDQVVDFCIAESARR